MQTEFPKSDSQFLKAEQFQDNEMALTFKGWEKKANVDLLDKDGNCKMNWKQRLKYCLKYSFPEYAVDETGEQMKGKDGKPFRNRHWDSAYPQGYSIVYHFDEGTLESGSKPLWDEFCAKRPAPGEVITIIRTGQAMETEWTIQRPPKAKTAVPGIPDIQIKNEPDELDRIPTEDVPF